MWQIGRGATARSAHLFVRPPHDCHEVASLLRTALDDRYGIGRVTLQTDHADSSAHEAENCADAHTAIHTASIR